MPCWLRPCSGVSYPNQFDRIDDQIDKYFVDYRIEIYKSDTNDRNISKYKCVHNRCSKDRKHQRQQSWQFRPRGVFFHEINRFFVRKK